MLLTMLVLLVILTMAARALVDLRFRGSTYTLETVPRKRVAIIFGALVYSSGWPSAMLADRVATGVDLYRTGKVDVLLMTGDNSRIEYNEPGAMREYALYLGGVPDEAIVLDYGGRRTYDSCYRARTIFQVKEAILVTQGFHLSRALMTCQALGIESVGVAADYQRPWGYLPRSYAYSRMREIPATAQAIVDMLYRPKPPILGEPLPIFPDGGYD